MTQAEEREIVISCQVLQELGFGLTRDIVNGVVCEYLAASSRSQQFKHGLPGPDWWAGFKQQWPQLSQRKPQHLSSARAACANQATVDSWFSKIKSFFEEKQLMVGGEYIDDYQHRLWNVDETGFCLGVASKKILARRGARAVHEVGGASDHQFITVSVCGNAAGLRLPPFILYKGKHLYNTWTQGGPAAACYGVSSSGWMEEANFEKWFELQFYPAVKHLLETGPVVMLFDGHYSHLGLSLIMKARGFGIHLICLPPNTTHILQPLDVGVFGPVKTAWRKILKMYKVQTRAANVNKEVFPGLIRKLWDCCITPAHLRSAFRCAGLVPFDPRAIKSDCLAPSLIQAPDSPSSPPSPDLQLTGSGHVTIGSHQTPVRIELRAYFVRALKPCNESRVRRRRRRVELADIGEVITEDEVVERLQKADAEKAAKKASKRGKGTKNKGTTKKSTSHSAASNDTSVSCGGCGQVYTEQEMDSWIGCDICESWWHYWCAGLDSMLQEEEQWFCECHD